MAFDRVVGLGLCVMDEIYRVDDPTLAGIRTRYRERVVAPGGMMSTAVAQAAALGCRTQLLSLVGDDADGRFLLASLRRRGVDTRRVIRSKRFATTTALVLVDRRSGERRFVVPDRRKLEREAPDFDCASLGEGTLLMVDGHYPRQALRALRRARAKGATVIADFHSPRPDCLRMLPYVDHPILPEEFCGAWGRGGPRGTLRALVKEYGATPVITLGERGAVAWVDGRIVEVPARRARVVDTTGAGDAFHGAFAAALYHGRSLPDALAIATKAAAVCCTALGGLGRLLTRDEMSRTRPRGRRGT